MDQRLYSLGGPLCGSCLAQPAQMGCQLETWSTSLTRGILNSCSSSSRDKLQCHRHQLCSSPPVTSSCWRACYSLGTNMKELLLLLLLVPGAVQAYPTPGSSSRSSVLRLEQLLLVGSGGSSMVASAYWTCQQTWLLVQRAD